MSDGAERTLPGEAGAAPVAPTFERPGAEALRRGLSEVLRVPEADVSAIERHEVFTSTHPTEALVCRFRDGREARLFCKYTGGYGRAGYDHERYGHRGGLRYEAEVFRRVLSRMDVGAPEFHGTFESAEPPDFWLVLGWIEGATPVTWMPRPDALSLAGAWLGRFHRSTEGAAHDEILTRYDEAYYLGWARRTAEFSEPWHGDHSWLFEACRRFEEVLPLLLDAPPAMIHGEFYGKNVVLRGDTVHAFDWESAAIGPGEIDLASITDGWWEPELVKEAESAYRAERWPGAEPPAFTERAAAARLYLGFRWLGDNPAWTKESGNLIARLRPVAEALGL